MIIVKKIFTYLLKIIISSHAIKIAGNNRPFAQNDTIVARDDN